MIHAADPEFQGPWFPKFRHRLDKWLSLCGKGPTIYSGNRTEFSLSLTDYYAKKHNFPLNYRCSFSMTLNIIFTYVFLQFFHIVFNMFSVRKIFGMKILKSAWAL